MFDLGWAEMAVVMLVALVVIGPKDLPKVARTIGQWTGKARALARDFQRSLDDMAREAELDEIKKSITKAGSTDFRRVIKDAIDPDDELEAAFDMDDDRPAAAKPASARKAGNARKAGTAAKPAAEAPKELPPIAGETSRVGEAPRVGEEASAPASAPASATMADEGGAGVRG